jgi:hypothetical protein
MSGLNRVSYRYRLLCQSEYPPAARVAAANVLLDRGGGKPRQAHVGEANRAMGVVVRQTTDSKDC